jgi:uncharacterized phage protein gp47/JayE
MTTYGVVSEGFARKPLADILVDLETAMTAAFGPAVIQTAESPLGQINGILADLATGVWELAEATYQSLDPDQAEGSRLDILGKIRGLTRQAGEDDATFARRITNQDLPDIHLAPLRAALLEIDGVTCVRLWENNTSEIDANGIPGHSLCVAVTGGADEAVAEAIHGWTVAGIGLAGNTPITITDEMGYCRTMAFLRPLVVPIALEVTLGVPPAGYGCSAPTIEAVRAAIVGTLSCSGAAGLGNGASVTESRVRGALAGLPGAEVLQVRGARDDNVLSGLPIAIAFDEIASFDPADIAVIHD